MTTSLPIEAYISNVSSINLKFDNNLKSDSVQILQVVTLFDVMCWRTENLTAPTWPHPTQNNNNSEITVDVAKFNFYFLPFCFACSYRLHFYQWPETNKAIIKDLSSMGFLPTHNCRSSVHKISLCKHSFLIEEVVCTCGFRH